MNNIKLTEKVKTMTQDEFADAIEKGLREAKQPLNDTKAQTAMGFVIINERLNEKSYREFRESVKTYKAQQKQGGEMKLEEIKTGQDAQIFCEGVVNDFDAGILGKNEVMDELEAYTSRIINLTRADERERDRIRLKKYLTEKNYPKGIMDGILTSLKEEK